MKSLLCASASGSPFCPRILFDSIQQLLHAHVRCRHFKLASSQMSLCNVVDLLIRPLCSHPVLHLHRLQYIQVSVLLNQLVNTALPDSQELIRSLCVKVCHYPISAFEQAGHHSCQSHLHKYFNLRRLFVPAQIVNRIVSVGCPAIFSHRTVLEHGAFHVLVGFRQHCCLAYRDIAQSGQIAVIPEVGSCIWIVLVVVNLYLLTR